MRRSECGDYNLYILTTEERPLYLPGLWYKYANAADLPDTEREGWINYFSRASEIVLFQTQEERVVGAAFFGGIEPRDTCDAHVAFWEDVPHSDRIALGKIACTGVLNLYELLRIETYVPFPNTQVVDYAKELGFQMVGRIPRGMRYEGKPRDVSFLVFTEEV